jgi:hypothetical protein
MEGVVRSPSEFLDDAGLAAVHDRHTRVGGAEVDTNDLAHDVFSS